MPVEGAKSTKEGGSIYSYQVADESGTAIANFWNEIGASIRVGDILLMAGGYGREASTVCCVYPHYRFVTMYKSTIRIACKLGTLVKLDHFKMVFNDQVDASKPLWLPNPENEHELVRQEEPPKKILKK